MQPKEVQLSVVIVPGKELRCILGKRAFEGMKLITVQPYKFHTSSK